MDAEFLEQLKQMAETDIPERKSTDIADELHAKVKNKLSVDNTNMFLSDIKEEYQMPAYLKEQIIERTKQPDIQPVSAKRKHSKRMELFLYSCKVSAAVAASLVIIITVSATQSTISTVPDRNFSVIEHLQEFSEPNRISQKINKGSQSITDWLQDLPGELFHYKQ